MTFFRENVVGFCLQSIKKDSSVLSSKFPAVTQIHGRCSLYLGHFIPFVTLGTRAVDMNMKPLLPFVL